VLAVTTAILSDVPFRVFVDANILVPARWRDIVLSLAAAEVCEVFWSPAVLEEVGRHLPDGMSEGDRKHLFSTMDTAFPEASVVWPGSVDIAVRLQINDKDRHVVAAALWAKADIVLTDDGDLHDEVLASGLLDAQRMPVFLAYAIDSNPEMALAGLIDLARRRWLRDPAVTDSAVLAKLRTYFEKQGWPTSSLTCSR